MAYTSFTPETRVQEAQDGTAFKINDASTWSGESGSTSYCVVRLFHYAADGTITQYDDYAMITGIDKTKFNEYLGIDGHIIEITDLTISGASAGSVFADGYYLVKMIYSDGTYAVGSEPYYDNYQAFLAKARCKARKLPSKLSWPFTDDVYRINRDIHLLRMWLDSAEDAADLGKENEYRHIIALVNDIFDYYSIAECF